MKRRFAFYAFISFLITAFLIVGATCVRVIEMGGTVMSAYSLQEAQRTTPLLWLMDFTSLCVFVFIVYAGRQVVLSQQQSRAHAELAAAQMQMQEDHFRQVDALIARNVQLERQNSELDEAFRERAAMIQSLEGEIEAQHRQFESEARRLAEQAYHALQGQVDAHSRQLEAINLAMQYQRADIKSLRHNVRSLQSTPDAVQIARLSPAEIAAITSNDPLSFAEEIDSEEQPAPNTSPAVENSWPTFPETPQATPSPIEHDYFPPLAVAERREAVEPVTNETEPFGENTAPSTVAPSMSPWMSGSAQTQTQQSEPKPTPSDQTSTAEQSSGYWLGSGLADDHRTVPPVAPPPFVNQFVRNGNANAPDTSAEATPQTEANSAVPEVYAEDFQDGDQTKPTEAAPQPITPQPAPVEPTPRPEIPQQPSSGWHRTI